MKLSISNIAWSKENDEEMYEYFFNTKFDAIEIAPTRVIEENPYEDINRAKKFLEILHKKYQLNISSMQSIWYGKKENIFGTFQERKNLIDYTQKAIDFAQAIQCKNLVFGCPKNRVISNIKKDYKIAIEFFNKIGNYAKEREVYFSIEPNPTIYHTNFIVTTIEAINFVRNLNNQGIKINLDIGTMIQNNETIDILEDNIELINHVHISEPNLENIKKRSIHIELIKLLKEKNYKGYISIEMKRQNDIQKVKDAINYVSNIINENS